jgi:4-hydroxybenzoate polyprenyltransferase
MIIFFINRGEVPNKLLLKIQIAQKVDKGFYICRMNWLLALPRLIRLPNLIIVFLSQAIPYWIVLRPAIAKAGGIPSLTLRTFGLLTAGTVLTTLGGYVINDYFDRDIDIINKPKRAVIGRFIPPTLWLFFYWVLLFAIAGVALMLYRELDADHHHWPLWIFTTVSGSLFIYAWQLKCSPVMGNLFVSVLCGIVPVIVLLPEERAIWLSSYRAPDTMAAATGQLWMYALFAFLTNLLREQIKDMEDFEGDSNCGCHTLAVAKGITYAKKLAIGTGMIVLAALTGLLYYWLQTNRPAQQVIVSIILIWIPVALTIWTLLQAKTKQHFTRASFLVKILMLAGLFLLVKEWPKFL